MDADTETLYNLLQKLFQKMLFSHVIAILIAIGLFTAVYHPYAPAVFAYYASKTTAKLPQRIKAM